MTEMTITTREIIKGLGGGGGFLLFAFVLGMPLWMAAGVAAAVYVGLSLLLPKPAAGEAAVSPGLTARERDAFLASCRNSAAALGRLAPQVPNRAFAQRIRELGETASHLTAYLEKKPDAILLSYSVPRNLEYLVAMLNQYVAICGYQQAGQTAEEALRKVEGIFEMAGRSFSGMYQQLLNNDVAALETSAHTLEILMGVDQQTESPTTAAAAPQASRSTPPRLPQKGTTS